MTVSATQIMGILNVTPDSFSDGGEFAHIDAAVAHAHKMVEDGADIIDIGGESTRPGADEVSVAEELKRTIPVIQALSASGLRADISIDTRKPDVAKAAIEAGANIWNDVSALLFDPRSVAVAAQLNCPLILMHAQGSPKTMQDNPTYVNAVQDIYKWFEERVTFLINQGVSPENITLDPGIGFGKRHDDNLHILKACHVFKTLGYPILIGASRKSFIANIDEGASSDERLGGSLAAALWSMSHGADILRVHDVKETAQAIRVWNAIEA